MKAYRIKHKPTGLYYQPTKGRWKETISNLGESGKVYIARRPSLDHISTYNHISKSLCDKYSLKWKGHVINLKDDLEIIEYTLVRGNLLNEIKAERDWAYDMMLVYDELGVWCIKNHSDNDHVSMLLDKLEELRDEPED